VCVCECACVCACVSVCMCVCFGWGGGECMCVCVCLLISVVPIRYTVRCTVIQSRTVFIRFLTTYKYWYVVLQTVPYHNRTPYIRSENGSTKYGVNAQH